MSPAIEPASPSTAPQTAKEPQENLRPARVRPYQYYDVTLSICATCLRKVEAKVVFEDDRVYMLKRCPEHGAQKVLLADDVDYYRRAREVFIKPSEMPVRFHTPVRYGCPYDCGLCADHEQHSCIALVEIIDRCNLDCPICYASSGTGRSECKPLHQVEAMLDAVVRSEGSPDVVQISGGEPTLHPDFFAILDAARARPIQHLMVNTNGIRIANDRAFAERLATYGHAFEVYLQFDSFRRDALIDLRGRDLRAVRERAIERLNELGLSTTLVVTLKRGVNDDEIGDIVEYAARQPAVRGVTLQPIQDAGRVEGYDPATDRLTLTEVRRRLYEQTSLFAPEDILPVPCHPDAIAMAYALKLGDRIEPLTRYIEPELLLDPARSTITWEREPELHRRLFASLSAGHSPESGAACLSSLLCCLPEVEAPIGLDYSHLFRVIIMDFLDAHSFDVRSVKKSCVHVVHPTDGRMIPLDTYNLFYRDDLERTVLAPLREGARPDLASQGGRS